MKTHEHEMKWNQTTWTVWHGMKWKWKWNGMKCNSVEGMNEMNWNEVELHEITLNEMKSHGMTGNDAYDVKLTGMREWMHEWHDMKQNRMNMTWHEVDWK